MDGTPQSSLSNADLAPVGAAQRTWNWWHFCALWIGMSVCIPTYTMASGLIDSGMSWSQAMWTIFLGNTIVLLPMILNAHAGARYGIPFPVFARASFGVLGANLPAMLRALVACGWFGIQTWFGGAALYQLAKALWPGVTTLPAVLPAGLGLSTGEALGFPHLKTGKDVAARLKYRYTRNLAVEFVHCGTDEERQWFRQLFTAEQLTRPLTPDEKKQVLQRLSQVEGLERFLGRAFVGYKRFSIEGTDALVPMLDTALEESAAAGAHTVAISMAHRGRLNVLTNVLGKPIEQLFSEFMGRHDHLVGAGTGDVKFGPRTSVGVFTQINDRPDFLGRECIDIVHDRISDEEKAMKTLARPDAASRIVDRLSEFVAA
mgnify:CR=1 FL=1